MQQWGCPIKRERFRDCMRIRQPLKKDSLTDYDRQLYKDDLRFPLISL